MQFLNGKLQQTSLHNNQLNEEAFGLRSEVRQLRLQLDTCSLVASASIGSYKAHLHIKMKQLLDTLDNDTFLILKVLALTMEVNALQIKVNLAANSTENSAEHQELQSELQQKITELHGKTQEIIDTGNQDSALILQIISLQNQIWNLQSESSGRGGSNLQPDRRALDVQKELDGKLNELRARGVNTNSGLLQLISVYSKIVTMQKMISVHIKEGGSRSADIQRQIRQKFELLKKKIVQLNRDENNSELTKEILKLQGDIIYLEELKMEAKRSSDALLIELKTSIEEAKKQQAILEKQLEETDYAQAQQILKIISIMEEIREHQQTTPTTKGNNLWTQLKDKEREFAKAQIQITDMQQQLQQLTQSCFTPEERNQQTKLKIEHKMAELNRTGDPLAALILNVINLLGEEKDLQKQISSTKNRDKISELQVFLEGKQDQLIPKIIDIQMLPGNPGPILQAVKLINEIWDLQKTTLNRTTSDLLRELHDQLEGFIGEIDDADNRNIKLMLKTILVQSEIEHRQSQLSDPDLMSKPSQAAKLRNELETKRKELENYIKGMNERSSTTTELILNITDLQRKQRERGRKTQIEDPTTASAISELKEQLKVKEVEHAQHQAVIKDLQEKLNQTEARCSGYEQRVKDLQTDLDGKLKELHSKSPSQTSLAFQISDLTVQLDQLRRQLENSPSKSKAEELRKLIDEKNQELEKKIEELKEGSPQSQTLLQIIVKQVEIDKALSVASFDTDYQTIAELQDLVKGLISGIQDENTKLAFQIMAQKTEIETLKKQEDLQKRTHTTEIKDLENELQDTRNQIEEKTALLESSDMRITNLSAQIVALHGNIRPLEEKISNHQAMLAQMLAGLQGRLNLTRNQLEDTELKLKNADAKNFDLIKEIVDLKAELQKPREQTPPDALQKIDDLEKQLKNQRVENRKLDRTNKELKQQVTELKTCCTDVNTQCEDLQRQLLQSQEDADRLQQQLQSKDTALRQLQQELEEQAREYSKLQEEYDNLQNRQEEIDDLTIYPAKMTMDPSTAHPRLVLSAGNTEITTTDALRSIQDHPGRFDVILGVLGKTGFSAGRHYWEVSVRGKNCFHIGMASESAPRKGSLSFKPANGFWTIILNRQGQYKALDGTSVGIALETQPATLGILLGYKQGQISFYDADARSHMYTFVGQKFTDKIHPFVNFCVEGPENPNPIVLLSPETTDWIK
ncbi:unnamed protein product [Ophioblennius macclurei]